MTPRIGLIGLGYFGERHLKWLKILKDRNLIDKIELCDIDEDILKNSCKEHALDGVEDYKQLADKVDGAIVVTPSKTHYEIAKFFIGLGKPCLVEKPLALELSKANELVHLAEEKDIQLMTGFLLRYHPGVNLLKKRIVELGHILYVNSVSQRLRKPRAPEGTAISLGIHLVDMCNYVFGRDSFVKGRLVKRTTNSHSDFMSFYELWYRSVDSRLNQRNEFPVFSFQSTATPIYKKSNKFIVVGTKRSYNIDLTDRNFIKTYDVVLPVRNSADANESTESLGSESVDLLEKELLDFIEIFKDPGHRPNASGRAGLEALEIIMNEVEVVEQSLP